MILGTRSSDLARAQTSLVFTALAAACPDLKIETRLIQTKGDQRLDLSLPEAGALDKGLFTKELQVALLAGEIHGAVHSLKDLPTENPPGLTLAAVLPRADVGEVLVSRTPGGLAGLPENPRIGTSSPRREAQLRLARPDAMPIAIRGNVPTRLAKLRDGKEFDAILLAAAGLERLGLLKNDADLHFERLHDFLPAPGQGAIAIETTLENAPRFSAIHDLDTWDCVTAERELLRQLGGGCHLALGALARIEEDNLFLQAIYFENGNTRTAQARVSRSAPLLAAREVANQLQL